MIYQLNNYILYISELVDRIENNFINIYIKFNILDNAIPLAWRIPTRMP